MTPSKQESNQHTSVNSDIIEGAEPFEFGRGKKAILFIHGWTSSPRELKFLAEKLMTRYRCRGILLKGHGTHPSDLEGTHWKSHLTQLTEAFAELSMKYSSVAVVGLSYGAILALHLAARRKVSELVLLAPFMFSSHKILKLKPESELVSILPKFIQSLKKKSDGPIFNKTALKDHIAYNKMPVEPLKSVIDCAHQAQELLPKIKNPTLLIHSTKDLTSNFEGSVQILKGLGSQSKTLKAINKSNHIITLDFDRQFVEAEVSGWLKKPLA